MAQIFLRNPQSGDEFDLFFVAAVTSLLAVRFYLGLTGFPQIGHGGVHVAHMLFGGLLMLTGLILLLGYVGQRVQRVAAIVSGIGFGVFIDELGKFVTQDNNYFFQPSIALIYAVFVILFLVLRALRNRRGYTPREYLLGALLQLEEVAQQDLDAAEQARLGYLLANADPSNPLTNQLRQVAAALPPAPVVVKKRFVTIDAAAWYRSYLGHNSLQRALQAVLVLTAVYGGIEALVSLFDGRVDFVIRLAQLVAAVVAGWLMIKGAVELRASRTRAYELVNRSVLINIFITQFFSFYHQEFRALPIFVLNLLIFVGVSNARRLDKPRPAA